MAAAIPFISAAAAGIGAISSIKQMFQGSPKTPNPVAPPPVPTVNDAKSEAEQEQATNTRQGALANLLAPVKDQQSPNVSLRSFLGG